MKLSAQARMLVVAAWALAAGAWASPTLLKAIESADADAVGKLIESGHDPNTPIAQRRDVHPLCFAINCVGMQTEEPEATARRVQIVRLLIDAGVDVNAKSPFGAPLWNAATAEGTEGTTLVRMLLDAGASLESGGNDGGTALIAAVSRGSVEIVKLLLEAGASVSATDEIGATPLHVAMKSPRQEVVIALVRAQADVNAKDARGWTPLHQAAMSADVATTSTLLAFGADAEARTADGWTPLLIAAASNDPARMRSWLIEEASLRAVARGAAPVTNVEMIYPLMMSNLSDATMPSAKLTTLLRHGKADPDVRTAAGEGIDEVLAGRTDPEAEIMRAIVKIARASDLMRQVRDEEFLLKHYPRLKELAEQGADPPRTP